MEEFESLPEYQALIVAAAGKPERNMGDSVIPAEPPQWGEVRTMAINLAKTAPDQLALQVYRNKAEANVNGFAGFHAALATTLEMLQSQWDSLFPAPDLDDPDDMYYERVNIMTELSDQPEFLETLYKLPLVSVRGIGEFSTRDIDIASGTVAGSEAEQARCQEGLIRGAFTESDNEQLQDLNRSLTALPQLCVAIEGVFAEKTGQPDVLSLQRLRGCLSDCANRFTEYASEFLLSATPEAAALVEDSTDTAASPGESSAPLPLSSNLNSRAMATASFDAILRYYQQHEPSSPVRLLTGRAREFVDKSFFDVLQALAPDHRDNLPQMLAELQKQPLAALIRDSYSRHLNGETVPVIQDTVSSEAVSTEPNAPVSHEPDSSGNSHQMPVIESREQVLVVLQDIETYFQASEPASPIPLIINDIRRLVTKRFVELLAEFSRVLPVQAGESSE